MAPKPCVVFGFLGTQLDMGKRGDRFHRWRPSVGLCSQSDLHVDRLELFHDTRSASLAERVARDIGELSPGTEVRSVACELRDPWDFQEVYAALYDWAHRYPFDPEREDYLVHITTGTHVAQICWFLLVESRHVPARLVQTSPLRKPREELPDEQKAEYARGTYALIDLDLSRYDALAQRFERERSDALDFLKSGIPTRNQAFNHLIEEIERVVIRSTAPVLLIGPTGAGKSFLARRIYALKKARHQVAGAFIELNCATLRGDAAHSTLFGHRKGAFTGAAEAREGLLRAADGGVLFLDEIGELGADEQAMLLKAIEEKSFYPLGADREVTSDFQLIAGTHRDLRADVAAGRFRADLFARINLWTYALPGLAERREDIAPNIDHLLADLGARQSQRAAFSHEARAAYLDFALSPAASWRGNFRDLAASMTRLTTLADGGRITLAQVEAETERLRWLWARPDADSPAAADQGRKATVPAPESAPSVATADSDEQLLITALGADAAAELDWIEAIQLAAALRVCHASASLSAAGRILFNVSRTRRRTTNDADRLRKYLARYGLSWEGVKAG